MTIEPASRPLPTTIARAPRGADAGTISETVVAERLVNETQRAATTRHIRIKRTGDKKTSQIECAQARHTPKVYDAERAVKIESGTVLS
jgi:hypothetical protein